MRTNFGDTATEIFREHSDSLAVAFFWAHNKTGEWRHEEKAIVIKKHGRKLQSYFRYGLDYLRDILLNGVYHAEDKLATPIALLMLPDNLLDARS